MTTTTPPTLDAPALRAQFPALSRTVHGQPLAYLDNAATSQKPASVIDTLDDYSRRYNANVHRGLHTLSEEATAAYEDARLKVSRFLGSSTPGACVFTRGATEAINLVAHAAALPGHPLSLSPGDRVLISHMEHHSNIVPWQLACERSGATLDVVNVTDTGELDLDDFRVKLARGVKLVAMVWVSNALGTVNPIQTVIDEAHAAGAVVLVDACQAAAHVPIDVERLGCDFLAVSGHKMFGPTGIGVLYGRPALLAAMPPYQGGGEMIRRVTFAKTEFADPPQRFEAGTPHISGAIGLGAAADFLQSLDFQAIHAHEQALLRHGTDVLGAIDGLRLIGTAADKAPVLSFVIDGVHAYDLGPVLDRLGIAVRTGHHCAEPLMDRFGVPATVRASMALYNTTDELDRLGEGLRKAMTFFV